MKKSRRLDIVNKLVKLQEQMVLAEFSELQQQSDQLKGQLTHLAGIKNESNKKLMRQNIYIHELKSIKVFGENIETAIKGIQQSLQVTDRNYAIVGEQIKEIRTTLLSISRLIEKYQLIFSNEQALSEQKQTEEFLSYTRNLRQ